jgi:hypothetical protein
MAKVKQRLPEVYVKGIETIAKDKSLSAKERFSAMVLAVFGGIMFQAAPAGMAWDYAIPKDQWERLAGAFISLDDDAIAAVNYGLSWMNSGPGAYEEEEEEEEEGQTSQG